MKSLASKLILASMISSPLWAAYKPFPQSQTYPGFIKPNYISQDSLNSMVRSYYDSWKTKYLKSDLKSLPGGYYVKGGATGSSDGNSGTSYKQLGTSEGQGYGMILTALMAGHDPNAQTEFNGLFKTSRAFASSINSNLMGWIVADSSKAMGDFDSATDGDMDIAYALLLANEQWGSTGEINYFAEAVKIINNGLKNSYVTDGKRLTLGDWQSTSSNNSRPSDWMTSHLRAFATATGDQEWNVVIDTLYSLVNQLQSSYSPKTGLLPDFVTGDKAQPASPGFLEGDHDGEFYYNACRTPLRLVADAAHHNHSGAKNAVNKMVTWLKSSVGDSIAKMKGGYSLDGVVLSGSDYFSAAFAAPMLAASTADASNQNFLNIGWKKLATTKSGYYEDSINLLSMLLISGNWWAPQKTVTGSAALRVRASNDNPMAIYNPKGERIGNGPIPSGIILSESKSQINLP